MATKKNPGGPKALQVRVPKQKAEAMPESESPVTRRGEPTTKMRRLLRRADCHVGGDDWMMDIALCKRVFDGKFVTGSGGRVEE